MRVVKTISWFLLPLLILIIILAFHFELPHKKIPHAIDKIYVINMDNRPDRWKILEQKLKDNSLSNYERFPAVDGYKLKIYHERTKETFTGKDLKDEKKQFMFGEKYMILCPNITFTYEYDPTISKAKMTAGELGCYCSHLEILQKIIDKSYKAALVLEDDALLPENFRSIIKTLESSFIKENKWDILYLGYSLGNEKNYKKFFKFNPVLFNKNLSHINKRKMDISQSHAYITNSSGAAQIMKIMTYKRGYDIDISMAIEQEKIKAYIVPRFNIQQRTEDSDLVKMGR